jgi:hypothetical protein
VDLEDAIRAAEAGGAEQRQLAAWLRELHAIRIRPAPAVEAETWLGLGWEVFKLKLGVSTSGGRYGRTRPVEVTPPK